MPRSINTDEPIYRVVVKRRKQVENPNYRGTAYDRLEKKYIELSPGEPRFIFTDEEGHRFTYGPYGTLGAARGQLTRQTHGGEWNQKSLLQAYIQVGRVVWEEFHE